MIRLTALIETAGQQEPRALTHESSARTIIIGRDDSADFKIPLSTVSRQHARISESDGVFVVEDLGSTHGTLVNGRKLGKGEKKVLKSGDIIELAKARITCMIESEKIVSVDPGEGTRAIAAKAVQGILGRLGDAKSDGPHLLVLNGADEGTRFDLTGPLAEWSIGRSRDCEFVLNDLNVSRRHVRVKKDWQGYTVEDLGSKNGVIVNERLIKRPRRLRNHDEITIGPIKLVFVDPDASLLDALKDVPGFDLEEEVSSDSVPAAAVRPAGEDGAGAPAHEQLPDESSRAAGGDEEAVYDNIDPELLQGRAPKLPTEWIVVGGVGLVMLAAVLVLVLIVL